MIILILYEFIMHLQRHFSEFCFDRFNQTPTIPENLFKKFQEIFLKKTFSIESEFTHGLQTFMGL